MSTDGSDHIPIDWLSTIGGPRIETKGQILDRQIFSNNTTNNNITIITITNYMITTNYNNNTL